MSLDFYPTSMDTRAVWHRGFAANIGAFATKYNITPAQLAQIAADNAWIQHWVSVRRSASVFSQQLTAYFSSIAGNDPSLDPPFEVAYQVPVGPAQPPPGIEFRVREITRHIKGHSSYSEADGTLLGIIAEEGGLAALGADLKPSIQCSAAASRYEFSVVVTKRGRSDSWQVWARPPAELKWQNIATGTGKSMDVRYPAPDQDQERPAPVLINVRVQLRRNNENYGEVSDNVQVTVNP